MEVIKALILSTRYDLSIWLSKATRSNGRCNVNAESCTCSIKSVSLLTRKCVTDSAKPSNTVEKKAEIINEARHEIDHDNAAEHDRRRRRWKKSRRTMMTSLIFFLFLYQHKVNHLIFLDFWKNLNKDWKLTIFFSIYISILSVFCLIVWNGWMDECRLTILLSGIRFFCCLDCRSITFVNKIKKKENKYILIWFFYSHRLNLKKFYYKFLNVSIYCMLLCDFGCA